MHMSILVMGVPLKLAVNLWFLYAILGWRCVLVARQCL